MTKFSKNLLNCFLDQGTSVFSKKCHERYLSGDRSAIMESIIFNALYQKQMPEWLVNEILTIDTQIENGKYDDLNDFFGFKAGIKSAPKPTMDARKYEKKILEALFQHVTDNGKFNAETELRPLAKKLGVSQEALMKVYFPNKNGLNP